MTNLVFTIYQKSNGKDDDDTDLTVQKYLSNISFGVGGIIGYSMINGMVYSFISNRKNYFWMLVVFILDLLISPHIGSMFRNFAENFLDRVEEGKIKPGAPKRF